MNVPHRNRPTRQRVKEIRSNTELTNQIKTFYRDDSRPSLAATARHFGITKYFVKDALIRRKIKVRPRFKFHLNILPNFRFKKIRETCERKGRSFDLTPEYLVDLFYKQKGRCVYTGIKLVFGIPTRKILGTASLDRIDSSKGYIEGNVQWVHKHINMMKQAYSHDYFVDMCSRVAAHIKYQRRPVLRVFRLDGGLSIETKDKTGNWTKAEKLSE